MPDGLTHEKFRKLGRWIFYPSLFPIMGLISLFPLRSHAWLFVCLGLIIGYEIGRYVTPDWDIMGTTSSEGWIINEIPLAGPILFGISSTYGSIFRRHHRSFITHFPLVSTLPRYLLLFWWLWYEIYKSTRDLAWLIFIFIGMFIGTSIADAIHWYLDMIHYPKSE